MTTLAPDLILELRQALKRKYALNITRLNPLFTYIILITISEASPNDSYLEISDHDLPSRNSRLIIFGHKLKQQI